MVRRRAPDDLFGDGRIRASATTDNKAQTRRRRLRFML
jgi:hypothetical protein